MRHTVNVGGYKLRHAFSVEDYEMRHAFSVEDYELRLAFIAETTKCDHAFKSGYEMRHAFSVARATLSPHSGTKWPASATSSGGGHARFARAALA